MRGYGTKSTPVGLAALLFALLAAATMVIGQLEEIKAGSVVEELGSVPPPGSAVFENATAAAGTGQAAASPGLGSGGNAQEDLLKAALMDLAQLAGTKAGQLTPVIGQLEESDYQDRGDRFEGRRRGPFGGKEIELIGAMIEGPEPLASLPAELALSFYRHEPGVLSIVVRERNPRKDYWLDQVRPAKGWLVRSVNRFTWPASAALAEMRVDPANLLVLVRLGYGSPRVSELVAPAQLTASDAAFAGAGAVYRFTFLMSRPAEIEARLDGCTGEMKPVRLESPRRLAFDIRVILSPKGSQLCRLDLEGEMLDDAARVAQTVSFYRAPAGAAR